MNSLVEHTIPINLEAFLFQFFFDDLTKQLLGSQRRWQLGLQSQIVTNWIECFADCMNVVSSLYKTRVILKAMVTMIAWKFMRKLRTKISFMGTVTTMAKILIAQFVAKDCFSHSDQ